MSRWRDTKRDPSPEHSTDSPGKPPVTRQAWFAGFVIVLIVLQWLSGQPRHVVADEKPLAKREAIDASTLHHKVVCGYQGWFRCSGDTARQGWRHWSRNAKRIGPDTLTFEMWPDLTEYNDDEKYPAPASLARTASPPTCSVPPIPGPWTATSAGCNCSDGCRQPSEALWQPGR